MWPCMRGTLGRTYADRTCSEFYMKMAVSPSAQSVPDSLNGTRSPCSAFGRRVMLTAPMMREPPRPRCALSLARPRVAHKHVVRKQMQRPMPPAKAATRCSWNALFSSGSATSSALALGGRSASAWPPLIADTVSSSGALPQSHPPAQYMSGFAQTTRSSLESPSWSFTTSSSVAPGPMCMPLASSCSVMRSSAGGICAPMRALPTMSESMTSPTFETARSSKAAFPRRPARALRPTSTVASTARGGICSVRMTSTDLLAGGSSVMHLANETEGAMVQPRPSSERFTCCHGLAPARATHGWSTSESAQRSGRKRQLPSFRFACGLKLSADGRVQPRSPLSHAEGSSPGASASYVAAPGSLHPN